MTPDPAPYGADLPREALFADGRDYETAIAELDAANAEVLRLREKLGASQRLGELLGRMFEGLTDVVHAVVNEDIRSGAQEAIELLLNSLAARDLLPPDYPELPAPTEGDGRG